MAKDNVQLSTQMAERGAKMTPLVIQDQLQTWQSKHIQKLSALAGNSEDAQKIYTICMNTISKNVALLECTFDSIANCILQSFQLKLYPGPFQECAFVPMKKNNKMEAHFWPMYQGLVKLMLNAGNKAVLARVVFENDYFEYSEGLMPPKYAPAVIMGKKRGKALFCYSAICTASNMWQVEVMSPDQIAVIKSRSPGATSAYSPWSSKYEDDVYAMWSKTVLKRVAKFATKSAEVVEALHADNLLEGDPSYFKPNLIDLSKGLGDPAQPIDPSEDKDPPENDQTKDNAISGSDDGGKV